MGNLKDRIQLLISTKGLTNATFAEKIGVQPSNISHVLSGRNKPSLDLVHKILDSYKEVRTEWLMHGSGAMARDYSLFEMEEEIGDGKNFKVEHEQPLANKQTETAKIPLPFELNSLENEAKVPELKDIEKEKEVPGNMDRKIEKENPHKKHHKSIERIVVFYGDRTFKEYYPEP